MSKPEQFKDWPSSIHPGFGPYRAVVERIVDGDTLYAFCDLGLNQYAYHSIRFKDVDTPEIFTSDPVEKERGYEAKAYLEELCPPGTKVLLVTEKDRTSFGRYVGRLKLADGTWVNEAMNRWLAERGW